jgi:hypothetical protein
MLEKVINRGAMRWATGLNLPIRRRGSGRGDRFEEGSWIRKAIPKHFFLKTMDGLKPARIRKR